MCQQTLRANKISNSFIAVPGAKLENATVRDNTTSQFRRWL